MRDELSKQRRELPWEKVEKNYVFEGPSGKVTLGNLFGGCSQLLVYHFMFGPGWKEGCPSCSFIADQFDSIVLHRAQRDTSFVAVSRATLPEIEAFKKRMGWKFPWVSSIGNDFNYDYHVSFSKEEITSRKPIYNFETSSFDYEEGPGASVFYRKDRRDIPYLFDLRPGSGHDAQRVQLHRSHAEGAGRGFITLSHRVGAAP